MVTMQIAILVLVGAGGGALALCRSPKRQALGMVFYGLLLTLMFALFAAPDVALSALVVGAAVLPLLALLTLVQLRQWHERGQTPERKEPG